MQKILFTGMGADPELFIKNVTTGQIISAEGYIRGSKYDPFGFDPKNKMFSISLDNVLAEFTIPPATNADEFYKFLQRGINYVNSILPTDHCAAAQPAANLDPVYLQTEQAKTFGCEPDINAYTRRLNSSPASEDPTLRSAGGHIHLGYKNAWEVFDIKNPNEHVLDQDEVRQQVVKALDLFVGVPSTLLEPDNKRKELYGKAGAYRPKAYGLEYRTISNYYLANKKLTTTIYNQVIKAIEWLNNGNLVDGELGAYVQEIINTNNKAEASYLVEHLQLM